jgi:beta-N-acetylhexosaminidase
LTLFRCAAGALLSLSLATPATAETLEQMAGQMIVVGFQGDDVEDRAVTRLREEIAAGEIGGVMYLKTNVVSLARVRAMNAAFLAAGPEGLPPFITLDQEGGAVERLTEDVGFDELPRAVQVAESRSPSQAEALYAGMAAEIASLGFTVNFGPVVDLAINPNNQVIAKFGRAFGRTAAEVVPYAEAFVRAHRGAGVLTALKHFPGHGSSTADSHEGFVDITDTWKDAELEPYREMIADGFADFVMVGHLIDTDVDASGLPSSLSPEWIEGVLRGELGYDGVVISDDLEMGAIRDHFKLAEAVVKAVEAGMDVLLFSNTADNRASLGDEVRAILVAEAEKNPAFRARIEESFARIALLKRRIGGATPAVSTSSTPQVAPTPADPIAR